MVATFITTYKRTKLHERERERKEEKRKERKKKEKNKKEQNKYKEYNYPNESQNENAFGFNTKNMTK